MSDLVSRHMGKRHIHELERATMAADKVNSSCCTKAQGEGGLTSDKNMENTRVLTQRVHSMTQKSQMMRAGFPHVAQMSACGRRKAVPWVLGALGSCSRKTGQ